MNTLYTDRLILRPFRSGDEKAMYKNWTYDERVARYCRWYPHKDISETENFLNMCIEEEYCWAITIKGTDEPVGVVDLVGAYDGVSEIGYVLMYEHWGKGFMTEAVKAVIEELFRNGFDKVAARHNVDNPASGRVMEKCGMVRTGTRTEPKKFGSEEMCEVICYEISR